MFELIDEAEFRKYRTDCSAILTETCSLLKEKGISAQFTLVGSGARNLVTRNGNGPYDLDYNLEIMKAEDKYLHDLRHLKDTVRVTLDKATRVTRFQESQDSTSVLTAILSFKNEPNVKFSFDVAIIKRNDNGTYMRLVHNKNAICAQNKHTFLTRNVNSDQYTWNEVPSSHNVKEKADKIKKAGQWLLVRNRYKDLKNLYLQRQTKDKPSFIVYVEAVNEIYSKLFHR